MSVMSLLGAASGAGSLGTLFVQLTADSSRLVAGFNAAEMSVSRGSTRMLRQAGLLTAGLGSAFVAIGALAIREFAKFEHAMTESTAIMGEMSADVRAEMERTARDLAKNSVKSAEEMARSYFFLASAGLNAEQSIAALPTVMNFAIAGAFDMAKATDLITDAQSALGLTVKDTAQNMVNMNRISDVLVKANNLANATVEQFSTSLTSEAGAALKSFNIDVEEGVAVLAAFADQGVKAEVAGSGLSRLLRLMTSAAVANAAAYEHFGMKVFDSAGKIRNMADIIEDLEKILQPMSDQTRVASLEMLGFQARVQGVIMPLLGTSQKIRDYEKALRDAGGTTDEVANKQMQSFNNQIKVTQNRLKDILLTIGEALVPTVRDFNASLGDLLNTNDKFNTSLKTNTEAIASAFVYTFKALGWLGSGFMDFARMTTAAVLIVAKNLVRIFQMVTKTIADLINSATKVIHNELDWLIKNWTGWDGPTKLAAQALLGAAGLKKINIEATDLTGTIAILQLAEDEMWKQLSDRHGAGAAALMAEAEAARVAKTATEELAAANLATAKSYQHWSAVSKDNFADTLNYAHLITAAADKANAAMDSMGISQMGDDKFGRPLPIDITGFERGLGGMPGMGDQGTMMGAQMAKDIHANKAHILMLKELDTELINQDKETQARRLEALDAYNEQAKLLRAAEAQFALQTASTMFSDIAGITAAFAGEQSGIFKAMFAVSKAFAIAEAAVKIQQGIANAASLPFPANLAAMASVVAATASIVSNIQAVKMEYKGERAFGGSVASGSSYLVGESGPELFSPSQNGTIVPNDRIGGGVRVVVNNYTDARPEVREKEEDGQRVIEVMIRRVKDEIGSEIRDGRGNVTRAMESSYTLRRGR